ncbi:HAD domain-containing protein [Herbaspirillum frisingense]|uniref:HAD domain-containing protein n=1 Tax=Herbaspirillum frisingense TaxID=92645 RepID=UPI001EEBE385|nr:HAD domain-containing protein [Herbaspirillum frisingense]UIN23522.1 hypothetical protein LAZ82_10670 [Herbaspirillum frisingense]
MPELTTSATMEDARGGRLCNGNANEMGGASLKEKQRPVLFLDIDGVICTRKGAGWTRDGRPILRSIRRLPVRAIDPKTIKYLNTICSVTDAEVVVSSMWRIDRDVRQILSSRGFQGDFHEHWRTDADGPFRSDEIARWLGKHNWPEHIVIDDKESELMPFLDRLIKTNNYCGLRASDVDLAVGLLGFSRDLMDGEGLTQGVESSG